MIIEIFVYGLGFTTEEHIGDLYYETGKVIAATELAISEAGKATGAADLAVRKAAVADVAAKNANNKAEQAAAATVETTNATKVATSAAHGADTSARNANAATARTEAAITDAGSATATANKAAENANAKAAAAQSAATLANEKATLADQKATVATTAATGAIKAKESADTATTAANSATTKAINATDLANTAARGADTSAHNADTATARTEAAITDAGSAAATANKAAENADTKAAAAQSAATLANEKATLADQKATAANTAAAEAIKAKESANTATAASNSATTKAINATDLANTAARGADTSAHNADTATARTEAAITDAGSATTTANRAAENADAKATSAQSAATLATEKATLADQKATAANTAATGAIKAKESADTAADNANQVAAELDDRILIIESGKVSKVVPTKSGNIPVLTESGMIADSQVNIDFFIEDLYAYGIEWDNAVQTSACTRIGNMGLHRSLPVQSLMRGCLLDDDGNVVKYLNPTDWTSEDRSGASGQVMVELPRHYRKFITSGTVQQAWISMYPVQGYHLVPKTYISAYEAALQRSTGKLCSVANMDADYRGGNNNADWDGTYRSLLGRPVTAMSRTAFRTAARKRGAGSQWNLLDYNAYKAMFWLYYIEYANRNCQLPVNAQKDASGYTQGGLGNGVTTIPTAQWSGYNMVNPFVSCAHTDQLGNMSGEVTYAMPSDSGGVFATVCANRYRGIENPFGHLWKWADGVNIQVLTDADGGTSKVYVAESPTNFNDVNYNGYINIGLIPRSSGFVRELILGNYGEITPLAVGGSSTTFFCDYNSTSVGESVLRGVLLGGVADIFSDAGLTAMHTYAAPSHAPVNFGTRLCFIPTKNE